MEFPGTLFGISSIARTDAIAASQGAAPTECPPSPLPTFLFFLKQLSFIFTLNLGLEGKLSLLTSYGLLSIRKEMWLLDADPQEAERQDFAADEPGTQGGCWTLGRKSILILTSWFQHHSQSLQTPHSKWTLPSPACEGRRRGFCLNNNLLVECIWYKLSVNRLCLL